MTEIIQGIILVTVITRGKKRTLAELLKNIQPLEVDVPEEGDRRTLINPPLVEQTLMALQEGFTRCHLMSAVGKPSVSCSNQ